MRQETEANKTNTANVRTRPITVARGDGIGPEIMDVTLELLGKAGAKLEIEEIKVGEQVYQQGMLSGIEDQAWDSLRRTKVLLKGPITTPQGGGYKSLNVTIRKTMGLYANVRPCSALPFLNSRHPGMDVVIVRENEEDLYAGIEHQQTDDVVQCLKLISRPGCERIVRYAFEYARAYGRQHITCMTKDNIMKLTDGLFRQVFEEIGREYADIEQEHMIIDIGAARLADSPARFDMILTTNLYGDILSDIAAQIAGSVGLGCSANIGNTVAMFEAVHGSAPDIAGKNRANPAGLITSAVMMLVHIEQTEAAQCLHNALIRTLEDGIRTADLTPSSTSSPVGTREFAQAIAERLGEEPRTLQAVRYYPVQIELKAPVTSLPAQKRLVGTDIFIHARIGAETLGTTLEGLKHPKWRFEMISNRGVKVYPDPQPETFCTDHWRCRFTGDGLEMNDIIDLLSRLNTLGLEVIKTENLYTFNGQNGFSLMQGQNQVRKDQFTSK